MSAAERRGERLPAIDVVRGLVMVVMVLDHVRDYFSDAGSRIREPEYTTVALFFTRWISHFCAPAFFLLAGIGIFLSVARGNSRATHSRRLLTRGFILLLLDLVIVRLGWDFNFAFAGGPWFIVLSALGVAMIVLAGLIHLPQRAILLLSVLVIGGHNLLDWVDYEPLGAWEPLWYFLHVPGRSSLAGMPFYVTYPLIPWVAVMSLGYGLGPIFQLDGPARRSCLFQLGLGMTLAFVALRATNIYGDPRPWSLQYEGIERLLSFLATQKYPASLLFLLMTLGPILMLLAALDRVQGRLAERLTTLGRVSLFFYILHLYVIHAFAVAVGMWCSYDARSLCTVYVNFPSGYGFDLPVVYAVSAVVVIVCYPACVWFDQLKRRSKAAWLSYL